MRQKPKRAMSDITTLSTTELVAAYAAGTLSPVEAARAALDRIEALDGRINAFCHLDPERTLAQAEASEARWAAGEPCGLIDGVPVSVKDLMLVEGWPTRKGSRTVSADGPWSENSPVVDNTLRHGGVLMGKTTLPEFGWKGLGDSPLTGLTRNPFSPQHTAGGSSSGAAAGLATGMSALALGSDGGGSVRIPASFCAIAALKPTAGRIPYYPPSAMGTLSHCGPMARTVRDVALFHDVLLGEDPRDPFSLPAGKGDSIGGLDGEVAGLRIAYAPALCGARADPEVARVVAAAVENLAAAGAIVEEAEPPLGSLRDVFEVIWKTGTATMVHAMSEEDIALIDPGLLASARLGQTYRGTDYVEASVARVRAGIVMAEFHREHDLLVTPTVAVPPPMADGEVPGASAATEWFDWAPYCYPFNLTRQPAASVHCGFTREGLPVGLQIVGPLFADRLVLGAALAVETHTPRPDWPTR